MDRDIAQQVVTKLGSMVTQLGYIVTQLQTIATNTTPADSAQEPTANTETRSSKK